MIFLSIFLFGSIAMIKQAAIVLVFYTNFPTQYFGNNCFSHELNQRILFCRFKNSTFTYTHLEQIFRFDSNIRKYFRGSDVKVSKRLLFNDPYYYLQYTISGESEPKKVNGYLSQRLSDLWRKGIDGRGVVVGIVDDFVQIDHPDLAQNYNMLASIDLVNTGRPKYSKIDSHGTMTAGIIASRANNHICGVGVAPNAKFGSIRVVDYKNRINFEFVSQAITIMKHNVDIFNMGFGFEDDGISFDDMPRSLSTTISKAVKYGRGSLGSIFVWPAGNGGERNDFCGYDSLLQLPGIFVITSMNQDGSKLDYTERCTAIVASTLVETHNRRDGLLFQLWPNGLCNVSEVGTSGSAALAAGIFALVLQVNKNLSYRQIQDLIIKTAVQLDENPIINKAGYPFSLNFGFGYIDALALIELAKKTTIQFPELVYCHTIGFWPNLRIREGKTVNSRMFTSVCLDSTNFIDSIETVVITLTIKADIRGYIFASLTSPLGTTIPILEPRFKDKSPNGLDIYDIKIMGFYGEPPYGVWDFDMATHTPNRVTLVRWSLKIYGTNRHPNSREFYKNHFKRVVCSGAHMKMNRKFGLWCSKRREFLLENDSCITDNLSYLDERRVFPQRPPFPEI